MTKGQIISKRLLVSSYSSKKRMNEFGFLPKTVLKTNLFVRFLEESEDAKKSFQNYLTFRMYGFDMVDPINFQFLSNSDTVMGAVAAVSLVFLFLRK